MFGTTIRGIDSSRQLAAGAAIGSLIGIVPKDNLILVGLLVILIVSGANLLMGLVSGGVIAVVAGRLEAALHSVGESILEWDLISQSLAILMQWPLLPWTRLDNTLVMGGLCVGLMFSLPAYIVSFRLLDRFRGPLKRAIQRSRLGVWMDDGGLASDH